MSRRLPIATQTFEPRSGSIITSDDAPSGKIRTAH